MTDEFDSVIVGAGVIGLAIARAQSAAGLSVLLLERHPTFGTETSSRHSEVIHAGIYYPAGTLKATLCVRGRQLLYGYCESRGIDHRRTGKIIAAVSEEETPRLRQLGAVAEANGVNDLRWLDSRELARLEPELQAVAGLLSPSTGILDSHDLMLHLLADAERNGAIIAFNSPVASVRRSKGGFIVTTGDETEPFDVFARHLVNAAGLSATRLAAAIDGLAPDCIPPVHLAKGSYFALNGASPFGRLVYPLPQRGGLGIHATLDLAGQTRFGPDVEWIETPDYAVDESRREAFCDAIRNYWPAISPERLTPGYSGIRPKLGGPEVGFSDFTIQTAREHGIAGLINLFGIESPGLTSSLAIADLVAGLTRQG